VFKKFEKGMKLIYFTVFWLVQFISKPRSDFKNGMNASAFDDG